VGAAIVSFGLLTALVAFDGFPAGNGGDGAARVTLTRASVDAPEVVAAPAAAALGAAPGAVAPAPVLVASAATTDTPAGPGDPSPPPPVTPAGEPVPNGPGAPPVVPVDPVPVPGADPQVDRGNPVQNVVGGLDDTVSQVTGLDSNLQSVTEPVTDVVDQTLENLTGQNLAETVHGLGITLNGKPLIGEQGTGIAGTGLLP
jgi:hypothetical protein